MEANDNPFSMFGAGAAVDEPEVIAGPTTAPRPNPTQPPQPQTDELLSSLKRPKVDYSTTDQPLQDLNDLLGDIPTEQPFSEQFDFDNEEPEPETEPEARAASGSMVNLVVKNSDYAISTLLGWMNDRPASNFKADSDGKALLTDAVGNYSVELGVEFSPKAQLLYSYALVYGGGFITGVFNLGKKAVSWFFGRKKKAPGPIIEDVEIVNEEPDPTANPTKRKPGRPRKNAPAPEPRYCHFPGCKEELKPNQKSYCSIEHSAKHRLILRKQSQE